MAKVRVVKQPFRSGVTDMSAPDVSTNKTIQPVPVQQSNLEAEKGEFVVTNSTGSGLPETYMVGGKRHSQGGTPLNLPAESFIFSRDNSMKIKDPAILKMFGKSGNKKQTPADLAKQYDINEFRGFLADKNTDKLQKDTAELMIANYNEKLGKLALVQESKKGFPTSIPKVAMPYITSSGFNPASVFSPVGDQMPQNMDQARYGGQNNPVPEMYPALYQMGGPTGGMLYNDMTVFQDGGNTTHRRMYSSGNKALDAEIDNLYKTGNWSEDNVNSILKKAQSLGLDTGSSFMNPAGASGVFKDIKNKAWQYRKMLKGNLENTSQQNNINTNRNKYASDISVPNLKGADLQKFNQLKQNYLSQPFSAPDNSQAYYDLKHFVEQTNDKYNIANQQNISKVHYAQRYAELQDAKRRYETAVNHTESFTPTQIEALKDLYKRADQNYHQVRNAVIGNYDNGEILAGNLENAAKKTYKPSYTYTPQQVKNTLWQPTPPVNSMIKPVQNAAAPTQTNQSSTPTVNVEDLKKQVMPDYKASGNTSTPVNNSQDWEWE